MNTSYEQIIIGAGFAGLCMAIKLKQAGFNNFILLERNPHLGGTWWNNAYPGAACDVESHLYSYSFEPNPNWSRQFSPQEEILHYLERCAEKYELNDKIKLSISVTGAVWNETDGTWQVKTDTGEIFEAKALISCTGGLSQPALPDIKGIENFKGEKFHSARWHQNYNLKDKTVAVIGTGASAIQIVPAIASEVKELKLFQRTPPWILPKPDKEISSLRRKIYNALPFTRAFYRWRLYWVHEVMALGFIKSPGLLKAFSFVARQYIKRSIADETLREKVTPNYVMGCKRILLSNDYYAALQRKNVSVITEGIEEITDSGLKTVDGKEHAVDAIVFATGFQAAEGAIPYELKGKNGLYLHKAWKDGAEAYLGTSISGFPNLFLVVGPNIGLGHSSMILMIESQVHYIMEALKLMRLKALTFIDVKQEIQNTYNADLQLRLNRTVWQRGGCHSWYQTKTGKNVTLWPGFTFTFMRRTKNFEPDKYELVG